MVVRFGHVFFVVVASVKQLPRSLEVACCEHNFDVKFCFGKTVADTQRGLGYVFQLEHVSRFIFHVRMLILTQRSGSRCASSKRISDQVIAYAAMILNVAEVLVVSGMLLVEFNQPKDRPSFRSHIMRHIV